MNKIVDIDIKIPPAYKDLKATIIKEGDKKASFYDYYVVIGGRGSAKSESVGRQLLIDGMQEPLKIVCGREFQASIKESVYDMLCDFIDRYQLSYFYKVQNTEIIGANGTRYSFVGLRHSINSIKSMHDVDIFWGEEAQTLSARTLDILLPTIRKKGSRLYFTMNPVLVEDPAYEMLVVNPPPYTKLLRVNYDQNPYFPDRLRQLMEKCKKEDYEKYLNIWEGQCRQTVEGAIFTRQLEKAMSEGRISDDVEYNTSVPVNTYWDLGRSNKTAIWFAQYVGMQWRVLRCIVGFGKDLEEYISEIQSLPYEYGTHYLPHDARHNRLGMVRSIEDQVRDALGSVEAEEAPVSKKINGIEASKALMQTCWFHKTDCADGLYHLRRYAYKVREDGSVSKEPDHEHSDVADAFQTFALAANPNYAQNNNDFMHNKYVSSYSTPRLG